MLEQEIKLYVPPASRKAVAAQLALQSTQRRVRLRAMYFDTPDRQLARQRAAVRLRLEGRRWVQTFKMAGHDALSRIEFNHPRPGPQLDLSVYAGTVAQAVFDKLDEALEVRYETDVMRASREVRTRHGRVEIAYDVGAVRAGGLELLIHELEFELLSGKPEALFGLANRWTRSHGLVLDVRSKAERGDALANAAARIAAMAEDERQVGRDTEIARFWAPTLAGKIRLERQASAQQALDVVTAECLDQIIRNAAVLAEVDKSSEDAVAGPEHIHQLRVGMRRLRSAWRLFEGWAPLPAAELRQDAARYFAGFGAARDQDVLGDTLVPALLSAGMPPIASPHAEPVDAGSLAAEPRFQGWLLAMLAWNVGQRPQAAPVAPVSVVLDPAAPVLFNGAAPAAGEPAEAAVPRPEKLATLASARLRKWHRRLTDAGKRFRELQDEQRHDLRKRAKRLRYALSFAESLYRPQHVRPYRKRLATLQDVLGDINDLVVAREHYTGLTAAYPQAWFALGWIAARLDALYVRAETEFALLAAARPFWKK